MIAVGSVSSGMLATEALLSPTSSAYSGSSSAKAGSPCELLSVRGSAGTGPLAVVGESEQPSGPDAGRLVGGREAIGGRVGQAGELAGELAGVLDDLLALGPDPVGLGVEVLEPLLGRRR